MMLFMLKFILISVLAPITWESELCPWLRFVNHYHILWTVQRKDGYDTALCDECKNSLMRGSGVINVLDK